MAELQAGKTLLREFFDIMQGKGRKLDEASLGKPAAVTIEGFVARTAKSGEIPTMSRVERTAIKSFTTDVLSQIKAANGGSLTPQALIEAQQSYAMAAVRRFGDGPAATESLNQFKSAVREVMTEGFGSDAAKVDRIVERTPRPGGMTGTAPPTPKPAPTPEPARAPAVVSSPRQVADEVVDGTAPSPRPARVEPAQDVPFVERVEADAPPPAAAAPAPAPARAAEPPPAAGPSTPAWDPSADTESRIAASTALSDAQKAVGEQAKLLEIRDGMAIARGDAAQGLLKFKEATTFEAKLAAFERIDGKVDSTNKQVFGGVRRSGWLSDHQSTYETGSATSYVLTHHTAFKEGDDLFQDPLLLKRLRDYVAAGSYDQALPPVGVAALAETGKLAKAAKAAGKSLTDTEIDAGVAKWVDALKVELEANKKSGGVTKLDKDGLRTNDSIEKIIENRSMTPLVSTTALVQNAPGAWILPEEWTKFRAKLMTEMRGIELKETIANLKDHAKKLDTVDVDTDAMKLHFDKHRELARSPELRAAMPLTDSAKYHAQVDAETLLAAKESRAVDPTKFPSGSAPAIRPADDLFKDIYAGKLLSVDEINGLEKHFRANKLQTEIKVQVSGMRDLLANEGLISLNVDGIRTHLDAIRGIERRGDYIELTQRSPAAKAHDAQVAQAGTSGNPPAPRKIEDVRKDLFDGARVNKDELYQLEQHYRAVYRATEIREQVRPLQDMMRKADTADLPINKDHPLAAGFGGKGVHEVIEEVRKLSGNPTYQAHYPLSPAAEAAVQSGQPRAAADIMSDLVGGKFRVSENELLLLEGHARAGQLRAVLAENLERGVKISTDPMERATTLRDLASGKQPFDTVYEGGSSRTRTLEQAMIELGRRIDEERNWRAANNMPDGAISAKPRSIHEIVADVQSGKINPRNPGSLSLDDAASFSANYKQYLAGESLFLQAEIHGKALMRIYEQSNGMGKTIAKRDLTNMEKIFSDLERIMESSDYKAFVKPMTDADPDMGEGARKNITNILKDVRAGKPVSVDEVNRLGEFFTRWHAKDESTFGTGGLFRVFGPRWFDRQTGSMWTGVGAATLTGALVLGGTGLGVATHFNSSSPTTDGSTTTSQPSGTPGVGNTAGNGVLFQGGPTNPNLRAPNTIGGVVDRSLAAVSGTLQSRTAGAVVFSEGAQQQDRANEQVFIDEAITLGEKIKKRSPEIAAENLDALAVEVAKRMYARYGDHKLTVGEAIDSYEEALSTVTPEMRLKLKPAVDALSADIRAADRRDVVVLPAPQPTN